MNRQLTLDTEVGSSADQPGHSLEPALGALESQLQQMGAHVAQLARNVKKAQDAAHLGQLKDVSRLLADVQLAARNAHESIRDLGWNFDAKSWLGSGRYVEEVISLATTSGLAGVREVNGEILSFPVIVRIDAADNSLVMGKKRIRTIRPSHLVDLLRQARQKQASQSTGSWLRALENAYRLKTNKQAGFAVPLSEIYEALTLRPGQGAEFTELDFVVAIYSLDRSGPHTTKTGRLSFPSSTTSRGGKGYRFVTEQGEEKVYSAIRFDRVDS